MQIAIYGRRIKPADFNFFKSFVAYLKQANHTICVEERFYAFLTSNDLMPAGALTFNKAADISNCHFMLSFGGDGSLLDTLNLVENTQVPVLGINMGRLGFLAKGSKENAQQIVEHLQAEQYAIEQRSLIQLNSSETIFKGLNVALNEFTLQKKGAAHLITIHVYLNRQFLSTFWADGLIVATPTGSTAYSLSCGGPIIYPDVENFVITPVAAHNLNVRPIIVSDKHQISFEIESREQLLQCTLDAQSATINANHKFSLQKANFTFNLVRLKDDSFADAIRSKLNWGFDTRN